MTVLMYTAALLPAIILGLYIWRKDPHPEPFAWIGRAFLCGVLICMPVAMLENWVMHLLFGDAGRLCIQKDKGSTSMIQRQFRVGFNRAARIMDQLYDAGVVGQEETNKPRKVLMSLEEFEEMLNQ